MKKFIIIYSVVSVILLSIITLLSIQLHTQSRTIEVFGEIADQAHETSDFDQFVAYQSLGYRLEVSVDLTDAEIFVYQVIGEQDGERMNQLVVIINDKGTFEHATDINDTNDLSNIRITDEDTWTVIDSLWTSPSYSGEALTYGIDVYGFFYGAFVMTESREISINIDGYQGALFHMFSLDFELADQIGLTDVEPGLTESEINLLIDRDTHIRPEVTKDITYYLIVDVVIGAVVGFFLKRKNH